MSPLFEVLYYPYFEPSELWLRRYLMVYDKVWTVVPKDALFRPSRGVSEIANLIPNSFATIAPTQDDKTPDPIVLERLQKAFNLISLTRKKIGRRKRIILEIPKWSDDLKLAGHSFLHHDKVTRQMLSLLKRYGLINKKAKDIVSKLSPNVDDFLVVDVDAANIIVSNLADRIARRKAFSTVTDQEIPFLVSSLNAFEGRPTMPKVRSALSSAVLKFEIPGELQLLNYRQYKELREHYSDIRETFHDVIASLSNLYQLDQIENEEMLNEKIKNIATSLDEEIQRFKKSSPGKKVKRWVPLGIGSLATIAGAVALNPVFVIASASVSVTVTIVQELMTEKEPDIGKTKLKRLFAGMQRDIINRAKLKRLI